MRILQVVPYFPPAYAFGGPVKVAYEISRELVKMGNQVAVYTSDAKDLWTRMDESSFAEVDGIQIYYMKNLSMFSVRKSKLFITPEIVPRIEKEGRTFDIIHLHEYRTFQNVIVARYAKKHNIPYVLQAHGSLPRNASRQGLKWIYDVFFGFTLIRNASKIIALTTSEAQQYREMGVPEAKIEIIPNGIDLSKYLVLPRSGSFRKKYGITDNVKILLYLGRINKTKGIDFLITAYSHMVKNLDFNDTLLVIAGPDDGYLGYAKSLAQALGLANRVLFTGLLTESEKTCAFVDSTIVIYPSCFEPFGLVSLEAAASSKPVIVSDSTPMAAVIKEGKFGFSVKYGAQDELTEKIKTLLNDELLRQEMGQMGRRFVFENYGWADIVCKLEKVYEGVTSNRFKMNFSVGST
jgi:glycosyltransferase involved in cell wall biosynthesis